MTTKEGIASTTTGAEAGAGMGGDASEGGEAGISRHPRAEELRVGIVAGSTRPGSRGPGVARWLHDLAAARADATFEVIDLADYSLPLLDEPLPPMANQYKHPHTRAWSQTIAGFDAYVFVTPEYNHSTSGALKNALDFLFAEWNDKACSFVSYGVDGGQRAVEHLRLVAGELKLAAVRSQITLTLEHDWSDWADAASFAPRLELKADVTALLDDLLAWARALKTLRAAPVAT